MFTLGEPVKNKIISTLLLLGACATIVIFGHFLWAFFHGPESVPAWAKLMFVLVSAVLAGLTYPKFIEAFKEK